MIRTDNEKVLLKDGEVLDIDGIKVECILVPGHTRRHMVYLIDDTYLFIGDTIWFGTDGGYSFLSTLAEDNRLAVQSLAKLEGHWRFPQRGFRSAAYGFRTHRASRCHTGRAGCFQQGIVGFVDEL